MGSAYQNAVARRDAARRLGLLRHAPGWNGRGVPSDLGDRILYAWRSDPTAAPKWNRLAQAIRLAPAVDERDVAVVAGERPELSRLERRTLYLLSVGLTTAQIAKLDVVEVSSVRSRVKEARIKLGAATSLHAVAIAIRRELLWH